MEVKIGKIEKGLNVFFEKGKEEKTVIDEEHARIKIVVREIESIRRGCATIVREAKKMKKHIFIKAPKGIDEGKFLYAVTQGLILSDLELGYKRKEKVGRKTRAWIGVKNNRKNQEILNKARIMAEAQNYARELANLPPNIGTPEKMRDEALKLAKKLGVRYKVMGKKELEKKGMNAILAVNAGSSNGVYLVELEYRGRRGKGIDFVLIGKGITFDSGGLQVKPGKYMMDMHLDKTGACIALAALKGIAELGLKVNVNVIVVFTENMNGGNAYKPGSILKSYNGKTIEVLHTDAEGRLTLADALAYASEKKPEYVFDIATLTGAMIIALGEHAVGIFSNSKEIEDSLIKAGEEEDERVWPFPMFEGYGKMVEGEVSDLKSIGIGSWDGEAGSITAAKFLEAFVGKGIKWVHIDIAGVMKHKAREYLGSKGGAIITRTVIRAIEELSRKKK